MIFMFDFEFGLCFSGEPIEKDTTGIGVASVIPYPV